MNNTEQPQSEFEDSYEDQRESLGEMFSEELGNVPRREQVILDVGASVKDAILEMNQRHVGCTLVTRGGKLAGIFTERDVLRKVAGTDLDLATTTLESVMTPDPDSLPMNATIAFALREMKVEGYRHIPLVNPDGSPAGVVSVRDIVGWLVDFFPDSVLNLPPSPGVSQNLDGG